MIIPVASVLYDSVALMDCTKPSAQVSILIGLYCIIWGDVFVLLERVIAFGRGLDRGEEIKLIALFGIIGLAFLSVGVYRHLFAIKSSKEW